MKFNDSKIKILTTKRDLLTGIVFSERYSLGGRLHRNPKEGPAYISRDKKTGKIAWEYFKLRGRFHREDGPAEISRNAEGNPVEETYWFNNMIHRDPKEGPAITQHRYDYGYDGGRKLGVFETYMVFGIEYRDPKERPCWVSRDETGKVTAEEFSSLDKPYPRDPRRSEARRATLRTLEP